MAAGAKLFQDLACITCHRDDAQGARPGAERACSARRCSCRAARRSIADEAYIRESILNPQAKVVAGFQPIMPTFQGLVTEEQLLQLIAYMQSLSAAERAPAPPGTTGDRRRSGGKD